MCMWSSCDVHAIRKSDIREKHAYTSQKSQKRSTKARGQDYNKQTCFTDAVTASSTAPTIDLTAPKQSWTNAEKAEVVLSARFNLTYHRRPQQMLHVDQHQLPKPSNKFAILAGGNVFKTQLPAYHQMEAKERSRHFIFSQSPLKRALPLLLPSFQIWYVCDPDTIPADYGADSTKDSGSIVPSWTTLSGNNFIVSAFWLVVYINWWTGVCISVKPS